MTWPYTRDENNPGFHVWLAVVSMNFLAVQTPPQWCPQLLDSSGIGRLTPLHPFFFLTKEPSTPAGSTPLMTGSCRKGSPVTISGSGLSGAPIIIPCDDSGTFSQNVVLTAGYGARSITITQTDSEGRAFTLSRNFNVVDVTPPTPPSGLIDGDWSQSLRESPTLSFLDGTDDGIGIDHHEVKIQDHTNGDSDLTAFAALSSGGKVMGLALVDATVYRFVLRAVDKAGNTSAEVVSDGWTVDSQSPTAPGRSLRAPTPGIFLRTTPTWTFPESTDIGGSGLISYKIQLRKSSDDSVITGFLNGTGTEPLGFI